MASWERKKETGLGSWMDELGMRMQDKKLAAGVLWPHQGGAKQRGEFSQWAELQGVEREVA